MSMAQKGDMLISMTTRNCITEFIEHECVRAPDVACPTVAFIDAIRRWAPGACFQAPTPRYVKRVLKEDYGITAEGSRHDWVFPGVSLKPGKCSHCNGWYDREDRLVTKRHLIGSCDRV